MADNVSSFQKPSPSGQPPGVSGSSASKSNASRDLSLADFQRLIRDMYYEKDVERGVEGTFMWLAAEFGELAEALRNGTHDDRMGEFADVLAWLTTIANVTGVDLTEAITRKYGAGCPGCGKFVCQCEASGKP